MKGIFKTLVIGALAIQTALLVIPHFWPLLYDGQELDLITWHGFGSLVDLSGPIPYLVLIPYAVITYGLVKFRPWARTGFIVLTIVAFLTMPVWGMAVTGPFEGMLANLLVMADGAIIVMLYLTGLAGEFRTSA